MQTPALKQPTEPTLKKYGLNLPGWQVLADRQGHVCAVCLKLPKSGRLCIDHFHVPKWKQMPPEQRKAFVRGLVCFQCNHALLRRGMTAERLRAAAAYLDANEYKKSLPPGTCLDTSCMSPEQIAVAVAELWSCNEAAQVANPGPHQSSSSR